MEQSVTILLIRGENSEGNPIFAYVAIRSDKTSEFMEAQKSTMFDPAEHGEVLESGEREPSDETRMKMETVYGFKHEAMSDYLPR